MAKKKSNGTAKDPEVRQVKKELPCELSEDEKDEKRVRIAEAMVEYDALEAKKKEATSEYATKMKALRLEMSKLAKEVDTGVEDREVVCEERPVFEQNAMVTTRKDTGKKVDERALTKDERQTKITIADPGQGEPSDIEPVH